MTDQLFTWPSVRPVKPVVRAPSLEVLERETRERAHADGLAEGRRQAEVELTHKIKELASLQQALEHYRITLETEQVSALADFIRGAFAALLGTTLRIEPELFKNMVQQAVDALPSGAELSIRAHPELAEALTKMLDQPIQADPSMSPCSIQVSSQQAGWSADLLDEFNRLLKQGMSGEV